MKFVIVLLLVFLLLTFAGWVILPAQAEDENHVGLVVQFDDSTISTYCVSFSEDSISGYDVLHKAFGDGLEVSFDSMGAVICRINGVGCPIDDCWCDFPPNYWSYWHMANNSWSYSQLGTSLYNVQNGSVEGYRWGGGSPPAAIYSIDEICQLANETPTTTATETPSLEPTTTTFQPTETTEVINYEGSEEGSTPYTIYFDTSSSSNITPSPTWIPVSNTTVSSSITTLSPTVEIQTLTPTIEIVYSKTPSISPTQKIKATYMKATRQAKKTQESFQKTMENFPSPTIFPSPTPTPQKTASDSQGMIKFMAVVILLLIFALLGTWVLKKRR